MSGHTMFHVFLDVLFIANIALFIYLFHRKNNPPGRIPRSEWPRPTDRVVDHSVAVRYSFLCERMGISRSDGSWWCS